MKISYKAFLPFIFAGTSVLAASCGRICFTKYYVTEKLQHQIYLKYRYSNGFYIIQMDPQDKQQQEIYSLIHPGDMLQGVYVAVGSMYTQGREAFQELDMDGNPTGDMGCWINGKYTTDILQKRQVDSIRAIMKLEKQQRKTK